MKKYVSYFAMTLVLAFGLTACDPDTNEEAGGTNVEKMAGNWEVMVYGVDENGEVVYEDPFGMGEFTLYTYNTASNSSTQMWLGDRGNFWSMKFLVDIDYKARTFTATERDYDTAGTRTVTLTDGKVLENATLNTHGMPNDSIVFDIVLSDDEYRTAGYWSKIRIAGHRYTGFSADTE